ncbi:MAG TPA: penicillin-binding protein 2 [Verrucomicrobiae bacterium]
MARKKALTESLIRATQIRRLCFFAGCIITGFIALGYKLVDVQVVQHERFTQLAKQNTERTIVRRPKRGDIVDAKGTVLATSKMVHTVCADLTILTNHYVTVAKEIAPHLEMTVPELAEMLRPRTRRNTNGVDVPVRSVRLKRRVEPHIWEEIRETMRGISFGVEEDSITVNAKAALNRIRRYGIYEEPQEIRYYPNQTLASHVLGFVGTTESVEPNGRVVESIVGRDGLEKTLDNALTGVRGWRQIETDIMRREVAMFRDQDVAPRPGLKAVLTIDAGVQHIVERELSAAFERHNPVSISCVVVRPSTGEIVAMANLPTFNPNDLGEAKPHEMRNRVITDQAEPGSTFKIVVAAAGINEGEYDLDDTIYCENGSFYFAGIPLRDAHHFGTLTVEGIIAHSSNIGSAKIGIKLGKERLYDYIRRFGFGERTGIMLPGEIRGTVHKTERWSGASISRIPMGHEVDCTPLQMVMAMAAIANRGTLMKPMLVDRLVDENDRTMVKYEPQVVRNPIDSETAGKIVQALKTTVSTNGTGLKAKLAYYTVAGKTGTAQKLVNGRYVNNKHYSSFIGFFPADNPELCISVVIDEPDRRRAGYYGSETAAPIFQKIAQHAAQYLAIPPEHIPDEAPIERTVPTPIAYATPRTDR